MTTEPVTQVRPTGGEKAEAPAEQRFLRQLPRLPGTSMPRSTGLLVVVVAMLVVEVVQILGLAVPVPAGILLIAVAYATYLDGTRVGAITGILVIAYQYYNYAFRGTILPDISSPLVRSTGLVAITIMCVVLVGLFRRRMETLLFNERKLVEEAEAQRNELVDVLSKMKRAQDAIRFQARLLDTVGQAVIATDRWGRIIYWNGSAAKLFGRSAVEASRLSITDVMPDPPGREEGTQNRLRDGISGTGEVEVVRPDGSQVTVLFNDAPIREEDGSAIGLVRTVADMTKRKDAEQAQRLLSEAASVLAESLDYQSTIRSVAKLCVPAFSDCCLIDVVGDDGRARRLEAAHGNEAREATMRAVDSPYEVSPSSPNPVSEVIATGMPRFYPRISEVSLRRDTAHADWLRKFQFRSGIITPLRAGGRTLGAISFYRHAGRTAYDDADLVFAEELANRAANSIQQARLFESAKIANRAKSDFLAVMSHELRTPLTTITGYTDLMLADVPSALPEKHRAYVERIRLAASHLLSLIEQILVYARLEASREQLQPERVAVADVMSDAADLIEPVARDRGITFSVTRPEVDTYIESDRTKLRQILLNLLTNAVKFTDQGEVRLAAERVNENIIFTVRDTGIGIDPRHMGNIFDPFWQVDQSSTRVAGGAGLGLSVTRKLANLLGGDVAVSSTPGGGTTFVVRLPVEWATDSADAMRSVATDRSDEVDRIKGAG